MDYPFDTTGLCSEDIDIYYGAYQTLKDRFSIEFTGQIDFHLEQFEVFRNYQSINLRELFVIKQDNNNDCYILFVQAETKVHGKSGSSSRMECQIWALAYMKQNFGRALIRRETLTDKIIELVHPVELDFEEDKAFSDTFYVIVNDRNKAVASMDRNFRNAVMDIRADDFVIEIVGHTLIIGSNQIIFPERSVHLAEFVHRLSPMC